MNGQAWARYNLAVQIDPVEPEDPSARKAAGRRSMAYAVASFLAMAIVITNATGPLNRILDASLVTMLYLAIMGSAFVMPWRGIASSRGATPGLRTVGLALNLAAIAGFVLLVKWALGQMAP